MEASKQGREGENVNPPRAEGGGQPYVREGKPFPGETQPWAYRKPKLAARNSWP